MTEAILCFKDTEINVSNASAPYIDSGQFLCHTGTFTLYKLNFPAASAAMFDFTS